LLDVPVVEGGPLLFVDQVGGETLKDEALEDGANLPAPEVIAADTTADLAAALEQFATIAEDLKK
jgi:hypothetical protein